MSDAVKIVCPQPSRPLKRKLSQLSSSKETENKLSKSRLDLFPTTPRTHLEQWLEDHISCSNRRQSRSDSFLACSEERRSFDRSDSCPLRITMASQLPSPRSMNPPSTYSNYSTALTDPRVRSPMYRDDCLRNHNIYIDPVGETITEPVSGFIDSVIRKQRTSPPMTDEQVRDIRTKIHDLASSDEDMTSKGLSATALFSPLLNGRLPRNLAAGGSTLPFNAVALPSNSEYSIPPIVQPKPDMHYGYSRDAFTIEENIIQSSSAILAYARPSTATYWPFFSIEFKSQSRGGTHWVAENQNAATGALCINSVQTLMNFAQRQSTTTDTVAFSCSIDAVYATLWIHWRGEEDTPRYNMARINIYVLSKPDDLRQFRREAQNIIDYGLDKRLSTIKSALEVLLPAARPPPQTPQRTDLKNIAGSLAQEVGHTMEEQPPQQRRRSNRQDTYKTAEPWNHRDTSSPSAKRQ